MKLIVPGARVFRTFGTKFHNFSNGLIREQSRQARGPWFPAHHSSMRFLAGRQGLQAGPLPLRQEWDTVRVLLSIRRYLSLQRRPRQAVVAGAETLFSHSASPSKSSAAGDPGA